MRRINLVLLATIICVAAFAQKKPKINKVERLLESGEIQEAKDIVDQGIVHEKTKDDEDTWFMRALTYVALDTTAAYEGMAENPQETAVAAFDKAAEIAGDKDPYIMGKNGLPMPMTQLRDQYYAFYFNTAASAFGDGDYEKAVANFESSQVIVPTDTNAYVNAAYAAQNGDMPDAAIRNYSQAVKYGAKAKDLYSLWSYLLSQKDKKEEALEVVRKGREVYPDDTELAKSEINLLIQLGQAESAVENLVSTIESEPDNADLRFTLGVLYDELGQTDKALEAYNTALEIDPNHYNSNYNVGVLYINKAQEVIKESNSLGMSKADQKKAEELKPEIDKALENALPQWEKLNEIQPGDKTTMETLQYLYTQLGKKKEAADIAKKLQSMN